MVILQDRSTGYCFTFSHNRPAFKERVVGGVKGGRGSKWKEHIYLRSTDFLNFALTMVEGKVRFAILEALKRPFRHFFRQSEK